MSVSLMQATPPPTVTQWNSSAAPLSTCTSTVYVCQDSYWQSPCLLLVQLPGGAEGSEQETQPPWSKCLLVHTIPAQSCTAQRPAGRLWLSHNQLGGLGRSVSAGRRNWKVDVWNVVVLHVTVTWPLIEFRIFSFIAKTALSKHQ